MRNYHGAHRDSSGLAVISRDRVARTETVRRVVTCWNGETCSWCGQPGSRRPDRLFQYGDRADDSLRSEVNWHNGLFCSKGCHDDFHR